MNILFVCTGNTCRSSMAEALLRQMLHKEGMTQAAVRSAGIAAEAGAKASPLAEQALQELGIDLSMHRAQVVDAELIAWADLVLTMTRRHQEFLLDAFPEASSKTHVLKEYLSGAAPDKELENSLAELYATVAAKQEVFAAEVQTNMTELHDRRAKLLQELAEVEQLLAKQQRELVERLHPEWQEIERIEQARESMDIVDPFGQPLAVYRASRDELKEAMLLLMQRLRQGTFKKDSWAP